MQKGRVTLEEKNKAEEIEKYQKKSRKGRLHRKSFIQEKILAEAHRLTMHKCIGLSNPVLKPTEDTRPLQVFYLHGTDRLSTY